MLARRIKQIRATRLIVPVAVALSFGTLAQTSVSPSVAEMAAIYEYFDVAPDDSEVFEILGYAETAGKYPRHLKGVFKKPPYLHAESICVLEILTQMGRVIDFDLVWDDDPPYKRLAVWLSNDPSDCIGIKPEQVPAYVHVGSPSIELDVILSILQRDDEILRRAANTPDGKYYGDVTASGFRITEIKRARKDLERDLGDYCVKYDAPKALMGPSICIEFEGQKFVIKSAGDWVT